MTFRIALSGLNSASADLKVTGNNIANASTVGFKKSKAEFVDIYAASNLGVAANAVGSGVKVSSVTQQFLQGNINFTDNNLDLAISGSGFFRLNDNGVTKFSRAGEFGVDRQGYVINSSNQRLTGYTADSAGTITGALGDLQLSTANRSPNASTSVTIGANLDSTESVPPTPFNRLDTTTYNHSTSLTSYDSLGNPILTTYYFRKTGSGAWNVYTYLTEPGGTVREVLPAGASATTPPTPLTMSFSNTGALTSVSPNTSVSTVGDYESVTLGTGAAPLTIDIDFTGVTQYGSSFSVSDLETDGYATGRLSGVDISENGIVTARYTNGQSLILGQVALANFNSPQFLRQLGDTSWGETFESGSPLIGSPGSGTLGLVEAGALEGSNVNLTEQLVNMITAQRNFQANAQVISTADTVTQTIINIR